MLTPTLFSRPLLCAPLRWLAIMLLKLSGWKIAGRPPEHGRYVLIAAPHTSNWDFVLMLIAIFYLRLDIHWMGKQSLFPFPIGGLMRWLGGIAIDRSQNHNVVQQVIAQYQQQQRLAVLMTPEGTRSKVDDWKTGFYHIAHGAQVPIVLGYIHAPSKTAGFGDVFTPSGDVEADIEKIRLFYRDKQGIRSELT